MHWPAGRVAPCASRRDGITIRGDSGTSRKRALVLGAELAGGQAPLAEALAMKPRCVRNNTVLSVGLLVFICGASVCLLAWPGKDRADEGAPSNHARIRSQSRSQSELKVGDVQELKHEAGEINGERAYTMHCPYYVHACFRLYIASCTCLYHARTAGS